LANYEHRLAREIITLIVSTPATRRGLFVAPWRSLIGFAPGIERASK
jgi:hypothetical protein